MFKGSYFKGRRIDFNKRVRVYRNLSADCYSVIQDGLVVAHVSEICLRDVLFIVRERGRMRVLKERCKNVHAFVEGYICDAYTGVRKVTYDPYKNTQFMVDGNEVEGSSGIMISMMGAFV